MSATPDHEDFDLFVAIFDGNRLLGHRMEALNELIDRRIKRIDIMTSVGNEYGSSGKVVKTRLTLGHGEKPFSSSTFELPGTGESRY